MDMLCAYVVKQSFKITLFDIARILRFESKQHLIYILKDGRKPFINHRVESLLIFQERIHKIDTGFRHHFINALINIRLELNLIVVIE